MSLVGFASAKASPGVTTTALALAGAWGTPAPVLVEADPDGGSLVARLGLATEPGFVALAAAARRAGTVEDLRAFAQRPPEGPWVVPGPASADEARAAWEAGAHLLDALLAGGGADVLVDCGRASPSSPALSLFARADLVVLVARPRLDEVAHVVHRARDLRGAGCRLGVVVVGDRPYRPADVASVCDVPLLGALPHDPVGAAAVHACRTGARNVQRAPLLRALHGVVERIRRALGDRSTAAARAR